MINKMIGKFKTLKRESLYHPPSPSSPLTPYSTVIATQDKDNEQFIDILFDSPSQISAGGYVNQSGIERKVEVISVDDSVEERRAVVAESSDDGAGQDESLSQSNHFPFSPVLHSLPSHTTTTTTTTNTASTSTLNINTKAVGVTYKCTQSPEVRSLLSPSIPSHLSLPHSTPSPLLSIQSTWKHKNQCCKKAIQYTTIRSNIHNPKRVLTWQNLKFR